MTSSYKTRRLVDLGPLSLLFSHNNSCNICHCGLLREKKGSQRVSLFCFSYILYSAIKNKSFIAWMRERRTWLTSKVELKVPWRGILETKRIRTDWETHTGINNNSRGSSSSKIPSVRLTDAHAEETASAEAAALISRRGCTQVKLNSPGWIRQLHTIFCLVTPQKVRMWLLTSKWRCKKGTPCLMPLRLRFYFIFRRVNWGPISGSRDGGAMLLTL